MLQRSRWLSLLIADWASAMYVYQSCSFQLDRENNFSLSPFARGNLKIWSCETDSVVLPRVSPLILHTQAKSCPSSRTLFFPLAFRNGVHLPSTPIGSNPSVYGYAIAYRWRSPPRVRRLRASNPQSSSSNPMDLLLFASLFSHQRLV